MSDVPIFDPDLRVVPKEFEEINRLQERMLHFANTLVITAAKLDNGTVALTVFDLAESAGKGRLVGWLHSTQRRRRERREKSLWPRSLCGSSLLAGGGSSARRGVSGLRDAGSVAVAGLALHVVHQQVLPEGIGSGEVSLAATQLGDFLDGVHQAVVGGQHEGVNQDACPLALGHFFEGLRDH